MCIKLLAIIGFVTVIGAIYQLIIFLISRAKKVSLADAKIILWKFIQSFFENDEIAKVEYPVFVGFDDCGRINSANINKEFDELHEIFSVAYYYDFHNNIKSNVLQYRFKVASCKCNIPEKELLEYIETLCEDILHRYMRKFQPCITVTSLVAAVVCDGMLILYVAKNQKGTQKIYYFKEMRELKFAQLLEKNGNKDELVEEEE